MFLRFVTARPVDGMGAREGIFQAAGDLVNDPLTDRLTLARVDSLREWFCDNLELPERFSKTKSKGFWRKETKGLSWFKPTARVHIAKAFELKSVLDNAGTEIDVLKERRIGYVVYEDKYQIVAEPFSETAT